MQTKILFVVLFVLAIAGCKSEAERACQQGEEAFAKGQWDEAVAHYRKALEIRPDYAEAHVKLGNVLTSGGQVDEAIAHYQKALQINPDYAEAHNYLGLALAGRGRVDEAIAHYRMAVEHQARLRGGPQKPRRGTSGHKEQGGARRESRKARGEVNGSMAASRRAKSWPKPTLATS